MCSGLTYSLSCTRKQLSQTKTCSGKYGSIGVELFLAAGSSRRAVTCPDRPGYAAARRHRGDSSRPAQPRPRQSRRGAAVSCAAPDRQEVRERSAVRTRPPTIKVLDHALRLLCRIVSGMHHQAYLNLTVPSPSQKTCRAICPGHPVGTRVRLHASRVFDTDRAEFDTVLAGQREGLWDMPCPC